MVQRVRDNSILIGEQWFKDSAVSIEAGCIQNGVFRLEILRDSCFKLLVAVLCSTDKTHRGHTESPLVHHLLGTFNQTWVIGKTKIVVGTEVQYFLAFNFNCCTLRTFNDSFLFVKSCILNLCKRIAEMFFHLTIHNIRFLFTEDKVSYKK